jgi:predicted GNAT family acetyltransferase
MSHVTTHNPDKQRYEIAVDGILAGFTQAIEDGDVVTFPHTVVFEQFGGQGLSSELIAGALVDVRVWGKQVIATCATVSRFIEKHPDYADLRA